MANKRKSPYVMIWLSALAVALFCVCDDTDDTSKDTARISVADTLWVVHTNDHHGAIFSSNGLGGLSQRAEFVKAFRSRHKNVLMLDAGDINTGGVLSNLFKAEPDILGYNLIGYDAVVLGNHEFDNSPDILMEQMSKAEFRFISANVKTADGNFLADPYIVKDFGGIRAAVIGITTSTAPQGSVYAKQFVFDNEIAAAREAVFKVREKENPDAVILLTHVGTVQETPQFVTSLTLADSVAGIDLIVDGHSHTRMESPLVVNGVPIVSAFEWGKRVGHGMFVFADGELKKFSWEYTVIDETISTNDEMDALIKPFADAQQGMMGDTIAETGAEFPFNDENGSRLPRMGESAIGNLVCDAVMYFINNSEYDADFALVNGGSVRAGLPQGVIIREDIFKVLPFENYVEIIELTGSQVIELFDFIATITRDAGGFAQISKEARYTLNASEKTASNITVGGNEIDRERRYFVATTDFLSDGGDSYVIFSQGHGSIKTQKPLTDIVIEYMRSFGGEAAVDPVLDGRITILGERN